MASAPGAPFAPRGPFSPTSPSKPGSPGWPLAPFSSILQGSPKKLLYETFQIRNVIYLQDLADRPLQENLLLQDFLVALADLRHRLDHLHL